MTSPTLPKHRFWIPITLLVLTAVGYLWLFNAPDLENNIRGWISVAIPLLLGILLTIWFMLLSGFPKLVRFAVLGLLVITTILFKLTVKIDGSVSGTGLPKYAWKWSKPAPREFAKVIDASAPTLANVPDVPQFLGTDRDGILDDPGLNPDWNTKAPQLKWRVDVGEGWGAFTVVGGRAITQEQRGEEEWITCYDLGTGKILWHHADKARFTEWQGGDGPRSTPTHDKGRLYVMGATGILNCLDVTTGKLHWKRDVLVENNQKNLMWAMAAAPLIVDGNVVIAGAEKPGPTLMAYDKMTGEPKWKAGDVSATYASPMLTSLAGKRVIVANVAPGLMVHDASTGEVLLFHKWGTEGPPKASQPIVLAGDRVFLSAGYMMGCVMLQITSEGGKLTAKELWSNHKMKTQFNSVTPRGDILYGLDDGRMAAMDAATGKRLWMEGKFGAGQHLLVGNSALIQSEPGDVVLAEVSRDGYKEAARLPALSSKTWNYPTLAGRYLLVRNDRQAACFELPLIDTPTSVK